MSEPVSKVRHAAVVLFLALGTACGTTDIESSPPPGPVRVALPATTQAGTAAEQAVLTDAINRYLVVYNSVYANPPQDLE